MINSIVNGDYIDLRGVVCPLNFVRCRLALEKLNINDCIYVYLDKGEPEQMVIPNLREEGHIVDVILNENTWIKLKIICQVD